MLLMTLTRMFISSITPLGSVVYFGTSLIAIPMIFKRISSGSWSKRLQSCDCKEAAILDVMLDQSDHISRPQAF